MARAKSIIEGNWLLFKTPDNHDLLLQADDIAAVWAGTEKATVVVERASRDTPVVIRYPSVRAFAADFTTYYDERRRPRAVRKPMAPKLAIYRNECASSRADQTKKR